MAVPAIKTHWSAELQVGRGRLGSSQRHEGQASLDSKNIKYIWLSQLHSYEAVGFQLVSAFGHPSCNDFRLRQLLLLGVILGRSENKNPLKNHVVIYILKVLEVKTHTNKTRK